jgi:glycosyltransferase involved in cell wall biosynthesis
MVNDRPKLVVLTPVRNEAWILPRFLEVTARLADLIIILDQNSTDGSVELCKAHPKVAFLQNPSTKYDEAERQKILIDAARRLVAGPRILLALDADEIIAADSPASDDWQLGMNAAPGTVLQIEKPTFLGGMDHVIRYPGGFPLGYIDDNSPHNPTLIHSVRIPMRPDSPVIKLHQVKALHYALMRPQAQAAKARMYSAIENVAGSRHLLARRQLYGSAKDYSQEGPIEPTPRAWLAGWEQLGIDMRSIPDDPPHWQDFELLRLFHKHGTRRFWLDDFWSQDWESFRQEAIRRGIDSVPLSPIATPPALLTGLMKLPDAAYRWWRQFRSSKPPRAGRDRPTAPSNPIQADVPALAK